MTAIVRVAAAATLAAGLLAGRAAAFQPIPLASGTYCGPGGATIVIDTTNNTVAIDGLVCGFPLIAGDHLQSDQCSASPGQSEKRIFDLHVAGRAFFHDGHWYNVCPAPAKAGG